MKKRSNSLYIISLTTLLSINFIGLIKQRKLIKN